MKRKTMTQRTVTRSALGMLLIGAITATTTVLATPSQATAGAADIPALNQQQAAAAKAKKNNRGAKKNNNRKNNNRGAKKNNRNNRGNKGARKNNNSRGSKKSTRPNRRSGQSRTLPSPRFIDNPDGVNPHVQAMGREHPDYGKNYSSNSRTYKNSYGKKHNRKNRKRHNRDRHDYDYHGDHYDDYGHHDGHGNHYHKHKKKVVKKKIVNKYYGYGGHGHHSHYGHGYYKPRVGFHVRIGSGVYAGYHSDYDYYDRYDSDCYDYDPYGDTYCRTTTYTRYGHHGTTTVRRTTCSTDAYGGYSHRPVHVNNTYVYGNTDYDNYRDYQSGTYSNNSYSTGTHTNNASTRDYVEVAPAAPPTPAPEPAMERVGLVGPWADLVNSKASEAQDIFDQIAKDYPDDGLPQLGFAVASAQRGQYQSAAASIERALEVDPASVDRMPDSVALRNEIRNLADELRRSNGDGLDRGAYWVTVAAFDYLSGDPYRAKASLDQATINGGDFQAVRGLQGRIER